MDFSFLYRQNLRSKHIHTRNMQYFLLVTFFLYVLGIWKFKKTGNLEKQNIKKYPKPVESLNLKQKLVKLSESTAMPDIVSSPKLEKPSIELEYYNETIKVPIKSEIMRQELDPSNISHSPYFIKSKKFIAQRDTHMWKALFKNSFKPTNWVIPATRTNYSEPIT